MCKVHIVCTTKRSLPITRIKADLVKFPILHVYSPSKSIVAVIVSRYLLITFLIMLPLCDHSAVVLLAPLINIKEVSNNT